MHYFSLLKVHELMEQQRELKRKRPRPSTDILQRDTDVQTEIAAARDNIDQINKAIDSILDSKENSGEWSGCGQSHWTGY